MSNCLLNVVAHHLRFYYAVAESIKDSRDVVFIVLAGEHKIHSFIHSGHFYGAPSSPLLLRGAPDYSTDTASEFHAEAHRQLQVKDLPKVPTCT